MNIEPIAHFRSPFQSKFGIPRQSGLANSLEGSIVFEPAYRQAEALRGLDEFDYIWLIWEFSENHLKECAGRRHSLTVRPPLLGGNTRMGVFATRSPFRPNSLGLSSVHLQRIDWDATDGPIIHVTGADLMDGTPIYDIKPYLQYVDSHPDARGGFTDTHSWKKLQVAIPDKILSILSTEEQQALQEVLALDPRPHYHDDPDRTYGMTYNNRDYLFRVKDGILEILSSNDINKK